MGLGRPVTLMLERLRGGEEKRCDVHDDVLASPSPSSSFNERALVAPISFKSLIETPQKPTHSSPSHHSIGTMALCSSTSPMTGRRRRRAASPRRLMLWRDYTCPPPLAKTVTREAMPNRGEARMQSDKTQELLLLLLLLLLLPMTLPMSLPRIRPWTGKGRQIRGGQDGRARRSTRRSSPGSSRFACLHVLFSVIVFVSLSDSLCVSFLYCLTSNYLKEALNPNPA